MTIDMTRVKAIVFDLGGVLIDVNPDRCFRLWAEHGGCEPQTLRQKFAIDEHYERHERGEIGFSQYAAHLRRRLAIEVDDAGMRAGWNALLGGPLPGAAAAIERAGECYPCFLFSNSNATHHAVWSQDQRELLAPLDRQFVSFDLGLRKPEPTAYAKVAALAGFTPDELLFFDDLEENVAAARGVGLQAMRVQGPRDILGQLERD